MYIFTANLIEGVDGVTLTNMAAPDVGCLHDYQLLPTDMAKLETADVFVFNGAGMENFLTDIAARNSDVITIEATKGISLLPMPDGSANPHVWLSIPLAIQGGPQYQPRAAGGRSGAPVGSTRPTKRPMSPGWKPWTCSTALNWQLFRSARSSPFMRPFPILRLNTI